jgi:hypothetical protein
MPRIDYLFTSFIGGVLSPSILQSRVDLEKYFDGVEVAENFIIRPLGGAIRRPGTRHVGAAKHDDRTARTIPFQFSIANHHILEFGHQYIRFFQDHAQLFDGGLPLEIASPFTEAMLPAIRYTQSADVLYLAHPLVAPQKLERLSATNWLLSELPHIDGPYLDENTTDITVEIGSNNASKGDIETLTASEPLWAASDVGRQFRFLTNTDWLWFTIVAFTSDTEVDARAEVDFSGITREKDTWRLGAWSDTTGWPATVGFGENRLWWGSTSKQPQTTWASRTNLFEDYQPSDRDTGIVADNDAITRSLDTNRVNTLRWINGGAQGVVIGGEGAEFVISAGVSNDVITPINAVDRPHTTRGSHATAVPARVDHTLLFVETGGEFINQLQFSFERDAFTVVPLTLLVDHLAEHRFAQLATQERPFRIVWALTEDGKLYGLTFEPDQKVVAWHTHTLGGAYDGGDPVIVSIASIFNGSDDELWLVVRRTINGATVHHIEVLMPTFRELDVQSDAYFLDDGLTYGSSGPFFIPHGIPTDIFIGADHLEGETIQIVADGAALEDVTVSGGGFTISKVAGTVHAGYHAPSELITASAELPITRGVSIGSTKRPTKAHLVLRRTNTLSILRGDGIYEDIPFRGVDDTFNNAIPLFSGVKPVMMDVGFDTEAKVSLRCQQPLPCTILAMRIDLELHDAR